MEHKTLWNGLGNEGDPWYDGDGVNLGYVNTGEPFASS
jgi:hypothetical protein